MRKLITIIWCFFTFGTPVYVKAHWKMKGEREKISPLPEVRIKVARKIFDPFADDDSILEIKDGNDRHVLHSNGITDGPKLNGEWTYVNKGRHVEMKLKNTK